jgi:hypothetical protein
MDHVQILLRKVVGTKCAPLQVKPSGQDNDVQAHPMFEQFAKTSFLPGHSFGAIPTLA